MLIRASSLSCILDLSHSATAIAWQPTSPSLNYGSTGKNNFGKGLEYIYQIFLGEEPLNRVPAWSLSSFLGEDSTDPWATTSNL